MANLKGVKALQEWARRICDRPPYNAKVTILNMSSSWKDGLAFCAIIHHFRPDLIDFNPLSPQNITENNSLAFTIAEEQLGIPALLDAHDMIILPSPDRLCIITYVAQLYNFFKDKSPLSSPSIPSAELKRRTEPDGYNYDSIKRRRSIRPEVPPAQEANSCAVCSKRVYVLERFLVDGVLVHRSCFRCARCNLQLKVGLYREVPRKGEAQPGEFKERYECLAHEREEIVAAVSAAAARKKLSIDAKKIDQSVYHAKKIEVFPEVERKIDRPIEPLPPPLPKSAPPVEVIELQAPSGANTSDISMDQSDSFVELTPAGVDQSASSAQSLVENTSQRVDERDQSAQAENKRADQSPLRDVDESATSAEVTVKPVIQSAPPDTIAVDQSASTKEKQSPPAALDQSASTPIAVNQCALTKEVTPPALDQSPPAAPDKPDTLFLVSDDGLLTAPIPAPRRKRRSGASTPQRSSSPMPSPVASSVESLVPHRRPPPPPPKPKRDYPDELNPFDDEEEELSDENPFKEPVLRRNFAGPKPAERRSLQIGKGTVPQVAKDRRSMAVSPMERKKKAPPPPLVRPAVPPPEPPKKKRPAPPRPMPPKRKIEIGDETEEYASVEEVLGALSKLDAEQSRLEERAKAIEERLREDKAGDDVKLLSEWFLHINEKNRLVRRETELVYWKREFELNDLHSEIEFQLRCILEKPESERTAEDAELEEELLTRLRDVVDEKNRLVERRQDELYRHEVEDSGIRRLSSQLASLKLKKKSTKSDRRSKSNEKAAKKTAKGATGTN